MPVSEWIVKARGLPWACTEEQLRQFFELCSDGISSVHFLNNREGRPSGEAYVVFKDEDSQKSALSKDRDNMGHRYIEVFAAARSEMESAIRFRGQGGAGGDSKNSDGVVRLRGLPFGCTQNDILEFFAGLTIAPNGVILPTDPSTGKSTGEAYVLFDEPGSVAKALEKHMKSIQHRYIEVFRSSIAEFTRCSERSMGGGGGGAGMDMYGGMGGGYGGMGGGYGRGMMRGGGGGGPMRGGDFGGDDGWGAGRMGGPRPSPYDRPDPWGEQRWAAAGRGGYGGGGDEQQFYWRSSMGGGAGGGYGGGGAGAAAPPGGAGYYWGGENDGGAGGRMRGGAAGGGDAAGGYDSFYGGWGGAAGGARGRGGMGAGRGGGGMGAAKGGRHVVKLRGIPFDSTEADVELFFKPLAPFNIEMRIGADGRPSGEATAEFATHSEALNAMKKDREHMGRRYVELFLEGGGKGGGKMGGGGGGYRDFANDYF